MNSRPTRRSLALLLAAGLIAAACQATVKIVPTPPPGSGGALTSPDGASVSGSPVAPSSPIAVGSSELAVYSQIQAQVERLRQLEPAPAGQPVLLDEQGVRDWMRKAFEKVDHESMAAQSRLLARMGLLPEGASLEQLQLDLNSGQAIGFYDTDSKKLFLLSQSGSVGPVQRLTFSHEYAHALQDAHFDLNKLGLDADGQSDRSLARAALAEGDASLAMTQWAQAHMSIADLLAVSVSEGSAAQTEQLAAAPAVLREDLLFPYTDGLNFVRAIYAKGGWAAVNKMYSKPPDSTSQILHPELYAQAVTPAILLLPGPPTEAGSGWKNVSQDTMGELQLRVWLAGENPTAAEQKAASEAVATWGGDRVGLYEGPDGAWAVVLRTTWRTAAGRAQFETAVNGRLEGLKGVSSVCTDGLQATVVLASSEVFLAAYQTCQPMD